MKQYNKRHKQRTIYYKESFENDNAKPKIEKGNIKNSYIKLYYIL